MASKEQLNDTSAIIQVLGSILKNPMLLEDYPLYEEDFEQDFHKLVFASIYNLGSISH